MIQENAYHSVFWLKYCFGCSKHLWCNVSNWFVDLAFIVWPYIAISICARFKSCPTGSNLSGIFQIDVVCVICLAWLILRDTSTSKFNRIKREWLLAGSRVIFQANQILLSRSLFMSVNSMLLIVKTFSIGKCCSSSR